MGKEQQQGKKWLFKGNGNKHQAQIRSCGVRKSSLEIHLGDRHQRPTQGTYGAHHQKYSGGKW